MKNLIIVFAFVSAVFVSAQSEVPLVYDVEHSGVQVKKPPLLLRLLW